jgi:UDP-N-acetylmuramyl pentapeptide synthase
MVSNDYFGQELHAQFARAASHGATDILINGGELCRAFRGSITAQDACSTAIRAELKPGDVVLIEAGAGVRDDGPLSVAA